MLVFSQKVEGFEVPNVKGIREYVIKFLTTKSKTLLLQMASQARRIIFQVRGLRYRTYELSKSIIPYAHKINQYSCVLGVSIGKGVPHAASHIGTGPVFTVYPTRASKLTVPLDVSPVFDARGRSLGTQKGLANVTGTHRPSMTTDDFPGIFRLRGKGSSLLAVNVGAGAGRKTIGVFALKQRADLHSMEDTRTEPELLNYMISRSLEAELPTKINAAINEFLILKRNWFRSVY